MRTYGIGLLLYLSISQLPLITGTAISEVYCFNYVINIDCNNAQHITIVSLNYGKGNCTSVCCAHDFDCVRPVQDVELSQYNAIMDTCHGKGSCFYKLPLEVPSLDIACPPSSSFKPYLRLTYSCTTATTTTTTKPTTVPPTTQRQKTSQPAILPRTTAPPPGSTTDTASDGGKNQTQTGLGTGALIGIIVGSVCAVILIVVLVIILLKRRRQSKPEQAQFPPSHSGPVTSVPIQSGPDELYGFLPGATVEPDAKRISRIKESQANGDSRTPYKDNSGVVMKNETKGGKKKSSSSNGKSVTKSSASGDSKSRPKSTGLSREESLNRKVPNVLAPGERRPARPKEVTVNPQYDYPRSSKNIQPSEPPVASSKDSAKTKDLDKKAEKVEPIKANKSEESKQKEKDLDKKAEKVGPIKAKKSEESKQKENLGKLELKETKDTTGAKSQPINHETSKNEEQPASQKTGETIQGIHNPAFDTEDHNQDSDES